MVCKALASLDDLYILVCYTIYHFNPQGSREPRRICWKMVVASCDFNPQGSREPRQYTGQNSRAWVRFQSTRLSRASTTRSCQYSAAFTISIHQALASLDDVYGQSSAPGVDFNPQGSREPRPFQTPSPVMDNPFQSTRLSRASTWNEFAGAIEIVISIHKALASLDTKAVWKAVFNIISIHKALASLDSSTNSRLPPSANFNPQGSREPRLRVVR